MILFLTDGLPTEGEIDTSRIIANVADVAPENVRLFAFGVGDDVDAILLDTLSSEHQGRTTYVRPGEALNEAVSGFYSGITAPVLADVEVEVEGVDVAEIYPAPLPDLFAGIQLIALGTYPKGGPATLTLRGEVNGSPGSSATRSSSPGWWQRLPAAAVGHPQDRIPAKPDPPAW